MQKAEVYHILMNEYLLNTVLSIIIKWILTVCTHLLILIVISIWHLTIKTTSSYQFWNLYLYFVGSNVNLKENCEISFRFDIHLSATWTSEVAIFKTILRRAAHRWRWQTIHVSIGPFYFDEVKWAKNNVQRL